MWKVPNLVTSCEKLKKLSVPFCSFRKIFSIQPLWIWDFVPDWFFKRLLLIGVGGWIWMVNCEGHGRKGWWYILTYHPNSFLVEQENQKHVYQNTRSQGWESDSGHPEYKARVPTTPARHFVWFTNRFLVWSRNQVSQLRFLSGTWSPSWKSS
jgi:hypothetical protein